MPRYLFTPGQSVNTAWGLGYIMSRFMYGNEPHYSVSVNGMTRTCRECELSAPVCDGWGSMLAEGS